MFVGHVPRSYRITQKSFFKIIHILFPTSPIWLKLNFNKLFGEWRAVILKQGIVKVIADLFIISLRPSIISNLLFLLRLKKNACM